MTHVSVAMGCSFPLVHPATRRRWVSHQIPVGGLQRILTADMSCDDRGGSFAAQWYKPPLCTAAIWGDRGCGAPARLEFGLGRHLVFNQPNGFSKIPAERGILQEALFPAEVPAGSWILNWKHVLLGFI